MKNERPITTMQLFKNVTIPAGTDEEAVPIDLREIAQAGFFSVYHEISGTGTVKLEYKVGVGQNGNYVTPDGAEAIGETLSGNGLLSFGPPLAPWLKIIATEDGGAADAVISLWVNIQ